MFAAKSASPLLDLVVCRLIKADWIASHRFVSDRGYVLSWHSRGRQRALLLQTLIRQYRLEDDRRAGKFHALCRAHDFHMWNDEAPTCLEQDFWRMCMEELEVGNDPDSAASFARVIAAWEPQFWAPGT